MDELVNGWLGAQSVDVESAEYDEVSWAIDKLFDLVHDDPDRLLKVIIEILSINSSQKVIGALGAGVIEDLLVHHGDKFIEKVIYLCATNPSFKKCLDFTYLDEDDVSPSVYKSISAAKN